MTHGHDSQAPSVASNASAPRPAHTRRRITQAQIDQSKCLVPRKRDGPQKLEVRPGRPLRRTVRRFLGLRRGEQLS